MVSTIRNWLRRLRLRRHIARATAEVRRAAGQGDLDSRVADGLLRQLAMLREEVDGGGGIS